MRIEATDHKGLERLLRYCARPILWARLLARIYEVFPLACPRCGEPMRIIAFVTDRASIKRSLGYVGEPVNPRPIWDKPTTVGATDPDRCRFVHGQEQHGLG